MPIAEFMQHVSRLGIPVGDGDAASLREDAGAFSRWIRETSQPTAAR